MQEDGFTKLVFADDLKIFKEYASVAKNQEAFIALQDILCTDYIAAKNSATVSKRDTPSKTERNSDLD